MSFFVRTIVFVCMLMLTVVSMWTTYASLNDSILREAPTINVSLGWGIVWKCSIISLFLSCAIGMMLFALKIAIIDEQKRLNVVGVVGMTVIAFISITFNIDVLYRMVDKDFYLRYSTEQVKVVYEDYLAEAQSELMGKRDELLRTVAKQEGELDAETRGLRTAPQGYGPLAKEEDYRLTLLQKTAAVDIESLQSALTEAQEADKLLGGTLPQSVDEIEQLQSQLRVVVKDVAAVSSVPMPSVVRIDNPLFAVFSKLFDLKSVGMKEIFILVVAFFLDLGDIIGYSLIPDKKRRRFERTLSPVPEFLGPEVVLPPALQPDRAELPRGQESRKVLAGTRDAEAKKPVSNTESGTSKRPISFRNR